MGSSPMHLRCLPSIRQEPLGVPVEDRAARRLRRQARQHDLRRADDGRLRRRLPDVAAKAARPPARSKHDRRVHRRSHLAPAERDPCRKARATPPSSAAGSCRPPTVAGGRPRPGRRGCPTARLLPRQCRHPLVGQPARQSPAIGQRLAFGWSTSQTPGAACSSARSRCLARAVR